MPASGTPTLRALAGLGVIWAISGCFNVNYGNCRITCEIDDHCPGSLKCVRKTTGPGEASARRRGRPVQLSRARTPAPMPARWTRAATTAPTRWMEATVPMAVPQRCSATTETASPFPRRSAQTSSSFCGRQTSRPSVPRSTFWRDQSGQGNDAKAIQPTALPHVIPNGVQLNSNRLGSGFSVVNSPSLDFGGGDFAVIVVAGLSSSTAPVTFFRKWDGVRLNSRRISIEWVLSSATTGRPQGAVNDTPVGPDMDTTQPSVRAYTLRRTTDHLDLYINEVGLGSADLPTAGASTSNAQDVFLGVNTEFGDPADSLEAVIAIRGSIESADLNRLQVFLRTVFAAP